MPCSDFLLGCGACILALNRERVTEESTNQPNTTQNVLTQPFLSSSDSSHAVRLDLAFIHVTDTVNVSIFSQELEVLKKGVLLE